MEFITNNLIWVYAEMVSLPPIYRYVNEEDDDEALNFEVPYFQRNPNAAGDGTSVCKDHHTVTKPPKVDHLTPPPREDERFHPRFHSWNTSAWRMPGVVFRLPDSCCVSITPSVMVARLRMYSSKARFSSYATVALCMCVLCSYAAMHIPRHICAYHFCTYVHIYIYRERERYREGERKQCIYIYIMYIYTYNIYIHTYIHVIYIHLFTWIHI